MSDFRTLADDDLADAVRRLERTVQDLREARGEVGVRVAMIYREKLYLAVAEMRRRAASGTSVSTTAA